MRIYVFGILLVIAGCKSTGSGSQVRAIEDSQSITQRPDGNYDVACKDGRTQVVTKSQIVADDICGDPLPKLLPVGLYEASSTRKSCKLSAVSSYDSNGRLVSVTTIQKECPTASVNDKVEQFTCDHDARQCESTDGSVLSDITEWTFTRKNSSGWKFSMAFKDAPVLPNTIYGSGVYKPTGNGNCQHDLTPYVRKDGSLSHIVSEVTAIGSDCGPGRRIFVCSKTNAGADQCIEFGAQSYDRIFDYLGGIFRIQRILSNGQSEWTYKYAK